MSFFHLAKFPGLTWGGVTVSPSTLQRTRAGGLASTSQLMLVAALRVTSGGSGERSIIILFILKKNLTLDVNEDCLRDCLIVVPSIPRETGVVTPVIPPDRVNPQDPLCDYHLGSNLQLRPPRYVRFGKTCDTR